MINTRNQNIQLAHKSFETINLQVDKLGVKQKFITEERKYFSKFATLANAFGTGDPKALDQNPILSVSKTTITSNVTVSGLGEFGKYLNIERTEEEIFVDISGGGLRGLKSITKTTKRSNVWLKVKSEDAANNTFEVFSSTNGTSSSNDKPKIEQIKLGSTEQESLQKLPNDLAETVKDDLDKNSQMVGEGLKSINKSIKKLEDKANNSDYLPK